jgi:hypothetical protein
MYSQPGAPLHSEYHGAGRGEYPPPPPESYYAPPPPMPPHIAPPPPPHHPYYDYHAPHHYMAYHPINPSIVPPQAPPSDFVDRIPQRRSKSNANTPTSTSESSDKSKASTFPKTPTLHKARFKKERFGTFDSPAGGEDEDKRCAR